MKFPEWLTVYGNTDYRGDCPPESNEQITFFSQLRKRYPDLAGAVAVHPRNEGKRTHYQTQRQKAEGMTTGASDVLIPGSPALVIEIKRRDHTKSTWQKGQKEYLWAAQQMGAVVVAALGWEAAMEAVDGWVNKYAQHWPVNTSKD